MKNKVLALSALTVALLGTGAFVITNASAQQAPPFLQHGHKKREKHPFLFVAMRALGRARMSLNKGAHDFQGHRAKAEELTEEAMAQVKAAIAVDRH